MKRFRTISFFSLFAALLIGAALTACDPVDEDAENFIIVYNPYDQDVTVEIEGDTTRIVKAGYWMGRYVKAGDWGINIKDESGAEITHATVKIDPITESHKWDNHVYVPEAKAGFAVVDCYAVYSVDNWDADDLEVKDKYFGKEVFKIEDEYNNIHLPDRALPNTLYGSTIKQMFIIDNSLEGDDEAILEIAADRIY